MKYVILALLTLVTPVIAQPLNPPFDKITQMELLQATARLYKGQRDEWIEKATLADALLGIMVEENKKLKAKLEEIEKSLKPPEPKQ